ncbi:MAG: hypothetical protein C5B50_20940 [Verrucomicrobia bacterium]|nr:MAG: hypothetical protein C5B50_20940 [Verrucomicrobiota bacterium]
MLGIEPKRPRCIRGALQKLRQDPKRVESRAVPLSGRVRGIPALFINGVSRLMVLSKTKAVPIAIGTLQTLRELRWPLGVSSMSLVGALITAGVADNLRAANPARAVFFVATNGNDGWSGHLVTPNRRKTDGPLATVERAVKTTRELRRKSSGVLSSPVEIQIRDGTYFLPEPLVLGPEDSGLKISAYEQEQPVLSGGRRIEGWKEAHVEGKRFWTAQLPEVRSGKWFFRELWVNGKRATRARHPNHGYLTIAELPDKTPDWTQGHTRIRFREGDFLAWPSVTNADVVAMTRWVESRLPVVSVVDKERIISFSKRSVFELMPGDLYYAEGALDFLDEPGEWCLDRAGSLYYMPRPGESITNIEAIAPVLDQVLRLEGRPESGNFIERLRFSGLTFSHTEWSLPETPLTGNEKPEISPEPQPEIGGFAQAAIGVSGAVWGKGARNCVFEECHFVHLGNYGLDLGCGCFRDQILGCELSDLGAGGIKIGETRIREMADEQARENEIRDCSISDGGKMFQSAIGIWLGQTPSNRIVHNLIHDFFYTGISVGWTWGYGPSLATNNLIAYNEVHHIGVKSDGDGPILSDMGGIYTLGRQTGTTIDHNLWRDIAGVRYGGWGIYFDEGSSGILAKNNIVYRTTHGGFHQHYGETNMVWNNIFAFARDHQLQHTRPEPHRSLSFQTNIVYFDSGVLLAGDWSGDRFEMDHNLYFDTRSGTNTGAFPLGAGTWKQWQARAHDRNSILADPLFAAEKENDFQLRPGSPAFQIGFRPIDLRNIGPDTSPEPVRLHRFQFTSGHMGTLFTITLYTTNQAQAEAAAEAAFQRVAALEDVMSDYRADSELMRLCDQPWGKPVQVGEDLFDALEQAQKYARLSGGAFDVTVGPYVRLWRFGRKRKVLPTSDELATAAKAVGYEKLRLNAKNRSVTLLAPNMRLDLGGIGKGYAADQALKVLNSRDIRRALVAASGDIAIGDPPPEQKGWKVDITGIGRHDDKAVRSILLHNCGISTSGDTEQFIEIGGVRYSHIIAPKTGLGLTNRIQATVIAPNATMTDGLDNTLCVLGPQRALSLVEKLPGTGAMILVKDGEQTRAFVSKRFKRLLSNHE